MPTSSAGRALLVAVVASSCSQPAPPPQTAPSPRPGPTATLPAPNPVATPPVIQGPPARPYEVQLPAQAPLPPVPLIEGPLAVRVVYPSANAPIPAVDSNYVFGSIGNGRASLTINGQPATVYPNGAFMAWVRTPATASPAYALIATLGADTARVTHPLRPPTVAATLPLTGKLIVDSSEFAARTNFILRDDELTSIRIRAPANATVFLLAGGDTLPFPRSGDVAVFSRSLPARRLREPATLIVVRGRDTVRVAVPAVDPVVDERPFPVRLGRGVAPNDSDVVVYGRPLPNDTYKWFFLPGAVVQLTGRNGSGFARIRLDGQLEAWVPEADIDTVAPARLALPIPRTTSNGRVRSTVESADLVIPMTALPTFFVEQFADRIELTLYNTRGNTDVVNMPTGDSLIRHVTWEALANDRVRFTLRLGAKSLGYMPLWDRGSFVLRVRRAPRVNPTAPLSGIVVALDPGHPPAGATGPTTLYEGQAVLWVAERAKQLLEQRGATVVMTRTTMDTVQLAPRRIIARRADAHAFVSIHLNAYPDGVNPFLAPNGTGTYFYRSSAEPLARAVQQGMLAQMGLRDEGVFFRSLAVIIQSWMPAILCEGAFVIIPEQEAAMRTAEYQTRYALGIVDGLERYFREIGR